VHGAGDLKLYRRHLSLGKADMVKNMTNQINSPIKWLQIIEYLMYQGECNFIELARGTYWTNSDQENKNIRIGILEICLFILPKIKICYVF